MVKLKKNNITSYLLTSCCNHVQISSYPLHIMKLEKVKIVSIRHDTFIDILIIAFRTLCGKN